MKDINLVLLNKRVQLAELTLEIDGLEVAATALRPVAHLISEDEPPRGGAVAHITLSDDAPTNASDAARTVPAPERSRVRRWV